MTTTAREKYEMTAIGTVGILTPGPQQSLDEFQNDVREIRRMADEGLVTITKEHSETGSGRRLIDIVTFRRFR